MADPGLVPLLPRDSYGDDRPSPRSHSAFPGSIGVAHGHHTARSASTPANGEPQHMRVPIDPPAAFMTALTLQVQRDRQAFVLVEADLGFWRHRARFEQMRRISRPVFSGRVSVSVRHEPHAAPSVSLTDAGSNFAGRQIARAISCERLEQAAERPSKRLFRNAEEAVLDWHYGRCALASNRDFPDPAEEAIDSCAGTIRTMKLTIHCLLAVSPLDLANPWRRWSITHVIQQPLPGRTGLFHQTSLVRCGKPSKRPPAD